MSVTQGWGKDEGFSLVEVLVGLMLTSVLLATLAILGSQFRSYLDANNRIEQTTELHAVARRIVEIIEQAEAIPVTRNDAGQDQFIKGQADRIAFVATPKLGANRSGFRDVVILQVPQKGLVMEARFHRLTKPIGAVSLPKVIELLNDEVSVQFQYFTKGTGADPAKWLAHWEVPAQLPDAVQVQVTKTTQGGKSITASAYATLWMR